MKLLIRRIAALLCIAATLGAVNAVADVDKNTEERIREQFKTSRPDLTLRSIAESPVKGLYEVSFANGPTVYATPDGRYFVLGDLYEVADGGFVNLAERSRQAERVALLRDVERENMIVFSPEGKTEAYVYVFTDVDCGFCQKLHREVPELNKLGIEVRYLAFPRGGARSGSYSKMVSAWCAKDRREALTALKNRESVAEKTCPNPVQEQYELGNQVGVTGTPAIVTADGTLIPGYRPAQQLAALAKKFQ